jgi:Domain of unknown function (DUF4157)
MTAYLPPAPQLSPNRLAPSIRGRTLQRKCACGGTIGPTGECEECRKKRETGVLRRLASSAQPSTLDSQPLVVPPLVHEVLRSSGQPLDADTRTFMEPRFGHDFSRVRVHSDAKAVESARAVNAHAYTVGHDIVFDANASPPGNRTQSSVLAHELAHVVQQQGQGATGSLRVAPADDPAEAAADRAADGVLSERRTTVATTSGRSLQRLGANPGCTSTQADAIHQAIFDANSMAGKALAALGASPLAARTLRALPRNFGKDGTAANARKIADRLRAGRDDMLKIPFSCTNASNDAACAQLHCGDTAAAGCHASNICSDVTLATKDTIVRASCVLHEALHACDSSMTDDLYSGWFGHSGSTAGYPGNTPLINADSYTTLAMELS